MKRPQFATMLSACVSAYLATFATHVGIAQANPTDAIDAHNTAEAAKGLSVTTWNVEHLAYPADEGCKPRSQAELAALRAYAASIETDVVALQEVGSRQAVQQLFPESEWQVYLSERADSESYKCRESGRQSTQQKVAFAVRKHLNVESVDSLAEFGLQQPGLRHALELVVDSGFGNVALLNVHLKSGCFVDDFSREESRSCQMLAQQAPILDNWLEQQEAQSRPYVILGDFNHRLSAPYNRLTRLLATNTDNSPSDVNNVTGHMLGCHPYYPAPIDHVLAGGFPRETVDFVPQIRPYPDMQPDNMLSDHCAVTVDIKRDYAPVSNSVRWQRESAEYRFLTTRAYQRALKALAPLVPKEGEWSVALDIDETVLDNSYYQVVADREKRSYDPKSWADWVASEQATLVPGALEFVSAVLEKGGKLALITNRNRSLDAHTWRNMQALGIPVTSENTCLMGRVAEDKSAIDGSAVINDKDLRRNQVETGSASCYHPDGTRQTSGKPSRIVMHVGDNIEDFPRVLQEEAEVKALLSEHGGAYVLLPNPMYGSWR